MYSLIVILLPSVIGVKLLDYLNKGVSLKNTIYYYLILVLLSNMIDNILFTLFFKTTEFLFDNLNVYPVLFTKCALVAIIINILLVFLIIVIQKNVKLEVVENKEKKKHDKNKKK